MLTGEHTDGNQGCALFDWVARQPDLVASIAALDDDAMRALARYLTHFAESGVPGLLLGIMQGEVWKRFNSPTTDD